MSALRLSRRAFGAGSAVAAGAVSGLWSTEPVGAIGRRRTTSAAGGEHVTVLVWLRGGCDALNFLAPVDDGTYQRGRPGLALTLDGPPSDRRGIAAGRNTDGLAIGRLGFPAAAAPLVQGPWAAGHLSIVYGVGLASLATRSHFEMVAAIERGSADRSVPDGFLHRFLLDQGAVVGDGSSPFLGVSLGPRVAGVLRGDLPTAAIPSVVLAGDYVFPRGAQADPILRSWYPPEVDDPVRAAGGLGFTINDSLAAGVVRSAGYLASPLSTRFRIGEALADVAALIRADLGMRVVSVEMDSWDTHAGQAGAFGDLVAALSSSLSGFWADLGNARARTTVVVMSEFGRTIAQNGSGGTDHGRAGLALVLDENSAGGLVGPMFDAIAPGVDGDLAVLTDIRHLIGEVLVERGGCNDLDRVFPGVGHPGGRIGLFA